MSDPIADFIAITGSNEEEAINYMSAFDFDVSEAVTAFYAAKEPDFGAQQAQGVAEGSLGPSASAVRVSPPPTEEMGFMMDSPSSSHPTTSTASPTLVDRMAGQGMFPQQPSHTSHTVPSSFGDTEGLNKLFAVPQYLQENTPIVNLCSRAAGNDLWLVLCIRDSSFRSNCITRDIWNHSAMVSLSSSIVCAELDVTTPQGLQAAQSFRVDASDIPVMFIVDPITSHREQTIQLRTHGSNGAYDGSSVVEQVLLFLQTHDVPSHYAKERMKMMYPDDEDGLHTPPVVRDVVDVDEDDEDGAEDLTASPLNAKSEVLELEPVVMDEWLVDEQSPAAAAFRLRVRLPKENVTLSLRPETPVSALMNFLAYRVHVLDPESYLAPPSIGIRAGFPPKEVTPAPDTAASVALSGWAGVRSGDALTVHII